MNLFASLILQVNTFAAFNANVKHFYLHLLPLHTFPVSHFSVLLYKIKNHSNFVHAKRIKRRLSPHHHHEMKFTYFNCVNVYFLSASKRVSVFALYKNTQHRILFLVFIFISSSTFYSSSSADNLF